MKISNKLLLAAALTMALPMGSAMACTVGNWLGTGTATDANNAKGPPATARYSGICALTVGTDTYVVDNSPGAEGTYRARFYVLTRSVSGPVTIFKATASDNGGGANVVDVSFNGSQFSFNQNGSSVGNVSGIQAGKWYSIEVFYKASASFNASVWGAGTGAQVGAVSSGTAGAGTIGSAVLGISSGTAATAFNFDAFESTRSETTPIGRLCRGDAYVDGTRNVQDAAVIFSELNSVSYGSGQPDVNEDGTINVLDASALFTIINSVAPSCSSTP
jgi:hypothetical protein